ncbi:putative nucleotidyltransferase substrate binding domain-containing protein [Desulfonatronum sp. SC1]|uniref:putative nucleotidyltransferase substrate binding domain-containing protein n=1 Tax=Desulfonatronum sp. SC1 TaxID=2109626 RepID=UPI000D3221DC|nr:putative nucleotidyltransferase substrate binding domain-containing protein [Desulfonatronum sp. SC1]PTN33965.1 hypothetical protein C6366_13870 [Desulfonatronum sp. SC1]
MNLCPADASVAQALIMMEERGANMVVIQDAREHNVGVLTDRDIKKCARLGRDPATCPVTDIMSAPIFSLPAQSHVFEAWQFMMPIVDFARIYALQHQIVETNTLERLHQLHQLNILSRQNHLEITQAFSYLMRIRLQCQAEDIESGQRIPDNYVSPHGLTSIEQRLLKEIFTQIKHFQTKLSYTFTGQAGDV